MAEGVAVIGLFCSGVFATTKPTGYKKPLICRVGVLNGLISMPVFSPFTCNTLKRMVGMAMLLSVSLLISGL